LHVAGIGQHRHALSNLRNSVLFEGLAAIGAGSSRRLGTRATAFGVQGATALFLVDSRRRRLPEAAAAASLESVRVTAWTLAFALEVGRDGLGACSFRSLPTFLVSVGAAASSSYSMPSSPREGMVTLGGRAGRSCEVVLERDGGPFRGEGA
jgi:hypothetical protein